MNQGRTVFSQLVEFLPTYQFQICVDRYQGNRYVKDFSCWDQFLCLAFAQLTYRESLRDIEACLRAQQPKLYHMGFRGQVSRNTLAHANEHRDWRIYAGLAQILIATARDLYRNEPFGVELSETVYALDSTAIDLCLVALFPWGKFRRHKSAVKLHTLLDLRGSIPTNVYVTGGQVHDGWRVHIQPAVLQFRRDGETLDAFGLVNDLLVGTLSPEDWVQKCLHLGIAEETLGVVKAQTIPTALSA